MASITPYKGGYRVHLCVAGRRESRTFKGRKEAQRWAVQRAIELEAAGDGREGEYRTTLDAFKRYIKEVAPGHRGARWEGLRLNAILYKRLIPDIPLAKLTTAHLEAWRDTRLASVKPGTVRREMGLVNLVLEACKGWGWLRDNPMKLVSKPESPPHSERVITRREIRLMLRALGYPGRETKTQAVAHAFLLALRTGMRQGELAALRWSWVQPKYVTLPREVTKSGRARHVPLSKKAARIVAKMRGYSDDLVFGVRAASIDALFRKAKKAAGVSGFTFHASRHTAATWIGRSGKIGVMDMCKMFGWADPKMAMVYFNPTADDIADRL